MRGYTRGHLAKHLLHETRILLVCEGNALPPALPRSTGDPLSIPVLGPRWLVPSPFKPPHDPA